MLPTTPSPSSFPATPTSLTVIATVQSNIKMLSKMWQNFCDLS